MECQPCKNPPDVEPGAVVVMGVAGCGKSSLGEALAVALDWPLVEGDDYHTTESRTKMREGVPLGDEDRTEWLDRLAQQLRAGKGRIVLTCSALKRAYRDRLRDADPGLRFVFLHIQQARALERVAGRGSHFFSPSLVSSQFAALEDPRGETDVLALDACKPLEVLTRDTLEWIRHQDVESR